jgi:TPR repeat protein
MGDGQTKDYAQAMHWCQMAADQGTADAEVSVGAMYDHGQGVPQDYAKALPLYQRAAAQGDATAEFYLGVLYERGRGVVQDRAAAARSCLPMAASYPGDPSGVESGSRSAPSRADRHAGAFLAIATSDRRAERIVAREFYMARPFLDIREGLNLRIR